MYADLYAQTQTLNIHYHAENTILSQLVSLPVFPEFHKNISRQFPHKLSSK